MNTTSLDIFCHIIDNFGDAGVAYRFGREFKLARPGCRVRIFISDVAPLLAIAPDMAGALNAAGAGGLTTWEHDGITYVNMSAFDDVGLAGFGVSDVMVEMFACHIPQSLMELAFDNSKLIINIEYLTAEDYASEYHLKESLLGRGSVRKFYFMPGFNENTGGLILNSQLEKLREQGEIDKREVVGRILRNANIANGVNINDIKDSNDTLVGTIFTYERGFDNLLRDLAELRRDTLLLVFGEKSRRGMAATLERHSAFRTPHSALKIVPMPFINQHDYDALLCAADFNIVRGEDSLARAVLSGKPFIWQAYIQDEKYHLVKAEALVKTMRKYYADEKIFSDYANLTREFNDMSSESLLQVSNECYGDFFENLKKHTHAAREIYYFMIRNCDLVKNFCNFTDGYQ